VEIGLVQNPDESLKFMGGYLINLFYFNNDLPGDFATVDHKQKIGLVSHPKQLFAFQIVVKRQILAEFLQSPIAEYLEGLDSVDEVLELQDLFADEARKERPILMATNCHELAICVC
jgi:hypothetical protein